MTEYRFVTQRKQGQYVSALTRDNEEVFYASGLTNLLAQWRLDHIKVLEQNLDIDELDFIIRGDGLK